MGVEEHCDRGLGRSGVVIVVTVSSKEFLGTIGTRFACGKPTKKVGEQVLEDTQSCDFGAPFSVT
jgi:hypothetical protein